MWVKDTGEALLRVSMLRGGEPGGKEGDEDEGREKEREATSGMGTPSTAHAPGAARDASCAQARAAMPAAPRRAATATFQRPAPTPGAPLSELLSTPLLVVVVLEPDASESVDGTWPSVNESPQTAAVSLMRVDDASEEDDELLLRAASSLVTRPCAQSVQNDAASSDWSVDTSSEVRVDTVRLWPVAFCTDSRSSVTQNELLDVYFKHRPSFTWLKLPSTLTTVDCEDTTMGEVSFAFAQGAARTRHFARSRRSARSRQRLRSIYEAQRNQNAPRAHRPN